MHRLLSFRNPCAAGRLLTRGSAPPRRVPRRKQTGRRRPPSGAAGLPWEWPRAALCAAVLRSFSIFERGFAMGLILLILVVLLLVGAFPTWPYARNWGYGPSGILGLLLVILLV